MSETNTGPFTINRRRFVGASAAVGGMVAAAPLLAGCAADEQAEGTATVNLTINGDSARWRWTTAPRCWTCCASGPS